MPHRVDYVNAHTNRALVSYHGAKLLVATEFLANVASMNRSALFQFIGELDGADADIVGSVCLLMPTGRMHAAQCSFVDSRFALVFVL
jgi:hypothetical protein